MYDLVTDLPKIHEGCFLLGGDQIVRGQSFDGRSGLPAFSAELLPEGHGESVNHLLQQYGRRDDLLDVRGGRIDPEAPK